MPSSTRRYADAREKTDQGRAITSHEMVKINSCFPSQGVYQIKKEWLRGVVNIILSCRKQPLNLLIRTMQIWNSNWPITTQPTSWFESFQMEALFTSMDNRHTIFTECDITQTLSVLFMFLHPHPQSTTEHHLISAISSVWLYRQPLGGGNVSLNTCGLLLTSVCVCVCVLLNSLKVTVGFTGCIWTEATLWNKHE